MLNWFKYHYNNVPVYITENGVSDRNGTLYDEHRVRFLRHYINEVLKGMLVVGCQIRSSAYCIIITMNTRVSILVH